jgi:hypothetical protein
MRKRLRAVVPVVMALVIAACGGTDGGAPTTGSPEAPPTCSPPSDTTTSQGATTTGAATAPTWTFESNPNDAAMCANIGTGQIVATPEGAEAPPAGLEHYCEFYPGQALISQNAEIDPEVLVPVEAVDLFLSGDGGEELDQAQAVLGFYGDGGIGAFKLNPEVYPEPDEADLFAAIDNIKAEQPEVLASPHYLLRPAGFWRYGPYSSVAMLDPSAAWDDLPITGPTGAPEGGRLVVIDTGANSDLSGIGITVTEPEVDPSAAYPLDPRVVGHGTFAASIAKQYNPNLNVELYRASWEDGTFSEATVVAAFQRFMARDQTPATVSLSAGTYPCRPDYNPLGLELAMSSQVVAASGNDGNTHVPPQLYPASHPDVIGVGAFDVAWQRAVWANPGEVYAPGENVVGWYHDGNPQSPGGLAAWSGTSFATPHHAACVASGFCPTQPTSTTTTSSP